VKPTLSTAILSPALLVLLAACEPDASPADTSELEARLADLEAEAADAADAASEMAARVNELESENADLVARIESQEAFDTEDIEADLADQSLAISSLQTAMANLDRDAVRVDDIADMATQAWVAEQALASAADVEEIETRMTQAESNLQMANTDISLAMTLAEQGASDVAAIQIDYLTSASLDGMATQAWAEGEINIIGIVMDDLNDQMTAFNVDMEGMEGTIDAHTNQLSDVASELATVNATLTEQGQAIEASADGVKANELEILTIQDDYLTSVDLDEIETPGVIRDFADFLSVDSEAAAIRIVGANVQIVSGTGFTNDDGDLTGLGNLIIGYNDSDGTEDRTGSHNLIVGDGHDWTSYGSTVLGKENLVDLPFQTEWGN